MTERPNILLITSDQQHPRTVGALGNPRIRTPSLDRLVGEGTSFDRAYAANPVCSPSRASILTGQYPSRHGCWNIGVALPQQAATVSGALAYNGYRTSLFGKAHFQPVLSEGSFEAPPHIFNRDFWRTWNGPYYGFQQVQMVHGHADEPSSQGMHFGAWLVDQGVDPELFFGPRGHHREGSWDLPEEYHYTRWTADRTIDFLESRARAADGAPFFSWCSFQDPHNSYLAPEPWASMYDPEKMPDFVRRDGEMDDKTLLHRCATTNDWSLLGTGTTSNPFDSGKVVQSLGWTTREIGEERAKRWVATYYGMVSLMDHHIGRILDTLDRLDLTRNTILIFTSDHGDYLGNHGLWFKGPLHYEDIIRLPFIVRWPGHVPEDSRTDSLISLVDLAPTLLEATGTDELPAMQGVSQLDTWRHPERSQRAWCLIENRAEPTIYVKTLVTEKYKLNYNLSTDEGELYDLEADPCEFTNLFSDPSYSAQSSAMLKQLLVACSEIEGPYPPRQSFA